MKYKFSGEELRKSNPPPEKRPKGGQEIPPVPDKQRIVTSRVPFLTLVFFVLAAAGIAWFLASDRIRGARSDDTKQTSAVKADPVDGSAKAEAKVSPSSSDDRLAVDYLTPSLSEMRQLYNYVVESPFVVRNPEYYNRVSKLPFYYLATNDVVNAAAMRNGVEKDGKTELSYSTVFYGGAARYARLVGLAAAWQDAGHKDALKTFVAGLPRRICGCCSEREAVELIAASGLSQALDDAAVRQRAISYSSGTIVSVIAHEMGHHALGHMTGFYEKTNLEIARNQEREADSFASSVLSSSSFGEYVFAGTLFWHYAIAMQADGDSDLGKNHPLSKERFENFVRANREKAAAMGIVLKQEE